MKYCEHQNEVLLNAVQHSVRECFKRPAPDFEFKCLHGQRLFRYESGSLLYGGLKPAGQFRVDFSVIGLFSANIFTRRG